MNNQKELFKKIATATEESEYYSPFPEGYEIGKAKYIVIFGTVLSGLGKGIFSSSLAKLLKDSGLKVEPIKLEGYLNQDSGTLNPFRHGEVFVLDDGMETDMDLGTYERMLNKNLTNQNFTTSGAIYSSVLEQERQGKYLGRDVQIIPHVTGEIKKKLRLLARDSGSDVVAVEVGGTVGDLENSHYIEAVRELAYEEGQENVCFVTLTYIPKPQTLGEQKSKAAQLGVKNLMSTGIQPQIIACRAHVEVTRKVREKISIYTNVPLNRVVSMHDLDSIYLIPELLHKAKIDTEVAKLLNLTDRMDEHKSLLAQEQWRQFTEKIRNPQKEITVGITGKYTSLRDSYASILKALEHAAAACATKVNIRWIETSEVEGDTDIAELMKGVQGIIVPGGFGKRGAEGKIKCIKYVRENNIPYLGLCYGFQMAIIEFARNVCGLPQATSTELDQQASEPLIDILPEQKKIEGLGGNMRLGGRDVQVKEGTKAYAYYDNSLSIRERFRHRYECNPEYIPILEKHGLVFSGRAPDHPIMQILELPDHPFFIGTQYHGEFTSRPLEPNPLYLGFVKAVLETGK